ncbi:MAG: hypothetical protein Q8M06_07825 [Methanobacteriaceae archaeon]|nr:hypothetical protein [Methanobacteriaceae archaeon]
MGLENQKIKNVSYGLIMDFLWGSIVATVNHLDSHPEKMGKKQKKWRLNFLGMGFLNNVLNFFVDKIGFN